MGGTIVVLLVLDDGIYVQSRPQDSAFHQCLSTEQVAHLIVVVAASGFPDVIEIYFNKRFASPAGHIFCLQRSGTVEYPQGR